MHHILWNLEGLVIFILVMKDMGKISSYLSITKYNKDMSSVYISRELLYPMQQKHSIMVLVGGTH